MENKNKFKKLLATASALAVITGGASSALAGERMTQNGVADFNGGGNFVGAAIVDGDWIKLHAGGGVVTLQADKDVNLLGINLDGHDLVLCQHLYLH